jgi:single-stranded-DNA-specific exonuclease
VPAFSAGFQCRFSVPVFSAGFQCRFSVPVFSAGFQCRLSVFGRESTVPKRWHVRPHDGAAVAALERASGVPPLVAALLAGRGVTDAAAVKRFLGGTLSDLRDPETLPGVAAAADRILAAVRGGRKVVVYGDYDADGMCATAILVGCLEARADAPARGVAWYVPDRLEEGYGLNAGALERLAADGAELVVTVDCGIASVAEAIRARELGLEERLADLGLPARQDPPTG